MANHRLVVSSCWMSQSEASASVGHCTLIRHSDCSLGSQVPIAVEGHIVNWIDSKATFGDERNHRNQYNEQYQQYVTRYGQGMVIYWFGFVRCAAFE